MSALRAVWHLARADFLERVRRYAYLVTLGAAAWLGYGVQNGTISLRFGAYRGEPNSAWIGLQMAMATAAFVSLAGFWVVRGAVERDRLSGVGAVLAATPLSRLSYACGKLLSNFLVLGSIVGVLAAAALVMQLLARDAPPVAVWPLLSPFLLLALPAMAATAALAVLFDCVPLLSGGLGNVGWLFAYSGLLTAAGMGRLPALDLVGFTVLQRTVVPFLAARFPGYGGAFSLGAGPPGQTFVRFLWPGIAWDSRLVVDRLLWVPASVAIAAAAALLFDRFDSRRAPHAAAREPAGAVEVPAPPPGAARLTPLAAASPASRFGALVAAELRLLLRGRRWWWWAVFGGLLVAQGAAPLGEARHLVLALAWIWPVLVWSALGAREARHGTAPLLFSAPGVVARQLPAAWLAGAAVALAGGSIAGLRLLAGGDLRGASALLAGALFIPALALALGTLSGTSKLFEAIYVVLWYVGPMRGSPAAATDFFGARPENAANAPVWGAAALVLVGIAITARWLRARR